MNYTELRKAPRIDLAANAPLPAPLTVYIEPTSRCNLACTFCPQSLDDYEHRAGHRQDMNMTLFSSLIQQISFMDLKSLKLYFFGEPFLHPQVGAMMALAAKVCDRVEMTTNGMVMTPKICQQILDSGIHYLRVSIYDEKPSLVMRNVDRLMAMRREQGKTLPIVCAKVFNKEDYERYFGMYVGIVDEFMVDVYHTIGSEFVQISQQPVDTRKVCGFPFYSLVVKASGDVVPCCVGWEDSLIVGNANHQTLEEIWKGPALARIHMLHLEGRRKELAACSKCDTIFNCPDNMDSLTPIEYYRRLKCTP